MGEFDLIETYFTWDETNNHPESQNIIKSVGDDAAVLALAPNQQLVTSIDTLVSGVHFPENTSAFDIGHKALAVNLSDLAAMGSKPEWFTLALTLPFSSTGIDHEWLSEFSRGLKTLAKKAEIALVGGDTTSGPLAISIQVMGSVKSGKALYRSGAKFGDKIYVTGSLGDGALGLLSVLDKVSLSEAAKEYSEKHLNQPTPRLRESALIKDFASSCIDVSDGLLQDLSHILDQSNTKKSDKPLGAEIVISKIPLSDALKEIDADQGLKLALAGGDDYELLFTIPPENEVDFLLMANKKSFQFTCIGEITHDSGIVNENKHPLDQQGFDHFNER